LCYDQDQNWSPTVINNGRVMFTRWEYSDTPHYFSRLMMTMNPDGTDQKAYYGSNSYWPNSTFFARPIPDHPTKFVGIVSGHHGVPRMGELVIFNPAIGRFEADGVVQRIPGFGKKVEPVIVDRLVDNSWPKFLHPYPLSDKYFLVSCQPTAKSLWGIYLVDIFDNMTLIKELQGNVLFEPLPLRKTKKPPVLADRVDLTRDDSTVMITDVYEGPGLADVPRGTVKKLRIYELHYSYMHMGGHKNAAVEGCWDVRRILGTVDVNADGSASFTVPANTPHAIQCLDDDGSAVQVMQSWYTSMPGEIVSCVGCHEDQNMTPPNKRTQAARSQPSKITPWYGPTRGFSFNREVQPVLDKYCVGCHNGQDKSRPDFATKEIKASKEKAKKKAAKKKKNVWGNFPQPYLALHPYVRRPGPESDYHLSNPYEYNVNTSELVQMLRKGHHGVKLDGESWDRIITWIDLNVPAHGTWGEHKEIEGDQCDMRIKMRTKYAGRDENPEKIFQTNTEPVKFIKPVEPIKPKPLHTSCEEWPFDSDKAKQLQGRSSKETFRSIDLGNGVKIKMVHIPAGKFIMGSVNGALDEMPASRVKINKSFWMAIAEITNEQFKRFDSSHDNGYFNQQHKDHTSPGYFAGQDDQPVIRVSWHEAVEFCKWLSKKTSLKISLPTEAQWEWACRAGSDKEFSFDDTNSDFSKYANLADASLSKMAVTGVNPKPIENPNPYDAFIPRITTVDDGSMLMTTGGKYQPNTWGLYDMHGNVTEWTLSDYVGYPYSEKNRPNNKTDKVARGGSWRDRPKRATSSFRLGYRPHQKVYNVGFRIIASDQ
jgi:formylglycine-generating enzyme required for sulfatase activity